MDTSELKVLLTETWHFFVNNISGICSIIMPFVVPLGVIGLLISYFYKNDAGPILWVVPILGLIVYPIYQAALIFYFASIITGEYLKPFQYYKIAFSFWLPLVILYLISGVVLSIGFILLIIPGLIVFGRIAFSEFHCIFDERSGMEAFNESWKNTKKYQWLLVSGITLLYVIIVVPLWGFELFLQKLDIWNPVFGFVTGVINSLLGTLVTIFAFRVYTSNYGGLNKAIHDDAQKDARM